MPDFIETFPDAPEMYQKACTFLHGRIIEHLKKHPYCSLALAGGSTPGPLYKMLSKTYLPWDRVDIFWSDERCVPPDHHESNYHMAKTLLLDHLSVPPASVHRIQGEVLSPEKSAVQYEEDIQMWLERRKENSEILTRSHTDQHLFHILLLGMGSDGHTASLFPKAKTLEERDRIITAEQNPQLPPKVPRITFTLEAINRSIDIIVLIRGREKGEIFKNIMATQGEDGEGVRKVQDPCYPISLVQGMEGTHWFVSPV